MRGDTLHRFALARGARTNFLLDYIEQLRCDVPAGGFFDPLEAGRTVDLQTLWAIRDPQQNDVTTRRSLIGAEQAMVISVRPETGCTAKRPLGRFAGPKVSMLKA